METADIVVDVFHFTIILSCGFTTFGIGCHAKSFERINIHHRTGSYIEMRPDGSIQTRTVKNHLDITEERKVVYAEGNITIFSNGGTVNIQGDGNVNLSSKTGVVNIQAPVIGFNA
jgi:hypothetical protein